MADLIQLRGDTAANWASTNPVLAQREFGIETDTGKGKIGDGVTPWNSRAYGFFTTVGDIVQGTNVTLTGTLTGRLLGSGNVTINASAGGGGADLVPIQNAYYGAQASSDSDATYGDGEMIATPLYMMLLAKNNKRVTEIRFNLSSGVGSGFLRVGLFKLTANTTLTRVADAGQISVSGGGIITLGSLNITLEKGALYFLVVKRDENQGGVVFLKGFRDHSQLYVPVNSVVGWGNLDGQIYLFTGTSTGTFPATLTLPTTGTQSRSNPFYKIKLED